MQDIDSESAVFLCIEEVDWNGYNLCGLTEQEVFLCIEEVDWNIKGWFKSIQAQSLPLYRGSGLK